MKLKSALLGSSIAVAMSSLLLPTYAAAEGGMGVGIAVAVSQSVYEDADDTKGGALPLINYSNEFFYVQGTEAGLYYQVHEMFRVAGIVNLEGPAYEEDDSDYLEGFDDREFTVNGGVSLTAYLKFGDSDFGEINLKALTELTDEHEGEEYEMRYSKKIAVNEQLMLTPYIGFKNISEDKALYNYGVTADQALANSLVNNTYGPDAATNPYVGISALYGISDKHTVMGGLEVMSIDSTLEDSPIVAEDSTATLTLGYMYQF